MKTTLQKTITAITLIATLLLAAANTSAETTITYLINDGLGSPIAAMDEQGAVVWRKDYQPYGSEYTQHPAATDERIGYTGHVQDRSSGLTYMGARYYDPMTGRFMAADPVGFDESNPMSFSRYGYANSNPYRYVDPDGREALNAEALVEQLRDDTYNEQIANRASKISAGVSTTGDALVIVGTLGPSSKTKAAAGPVRSFISRLLNRSDDLTKKLKIVDDIILSGGRSGQRVKSLTGPANSAIAGNKGRVYVTNDRGQVILDIRKDRVKPVIPGKGFGDKRQPTQHELDLINKIHGDG